MQTNAERDLLFGVLAVQLGHVSAGQVIQAASAWAADRSQGLAERLVAEGHIPEHRAKLLNSLVAEALEASDNDPHRALESLGASQVFASFGGVLGLAADGSVTLTPQDTLVAPVEDDLSVTSEHPGRYRLGGPPEGATDAEVTHQDAEIGRGGIGRVLLAFDEHLGREVALKELLTDVDDLSALSGPSGQRLASARARFLREARVTGQLEHPNIVPVYELGQRRSGGLYYTMRMVRGRSLKEALAGCTTLAERLGLLTHFVDLCQAIAYAHSRGVVHRDVKPDNVMLGEFGETAVLDWGLAKVSGKRDIRGVEIEREIMLLRGESDGRTLDGTALGTPAYMSPEQAKGAVDRIDERSDVWSLGAVLYEILTGRPPYEGLTAYEVIGKVLREPVTPVLAVCPGAPAELASVCEKALARKPGGRYSGAGELAREVGRYLTGGRVKAYEYPTWELLTRFARRHRAVLSVLLLAVVVTTTLGVWSHLRVVEQRNRAVEAEQDERRRRAEAQLEGARAAFLSGDVFEARAKLRGSLQNRDSAAARHLWRELRRQDHVWVRRLPDYVNGLDFSPDGKLIALGADGNNGLLIDARTRALTRVLRGHTYYLNWLSFSPDSQSLATASADKTVRIWDLATGTTRHVLRGHTGIVWNARYSPDGSRIASASDDGTIRVWDAASGKALRVLETDGTAWAVAFSPDGQTLYGGGHQGVLEVWDLASGKHRAQIATQTSLIYFIDMHPDGQRLAAATAQGLLLIDLKGGTQRLLEGHTGMLMMARFDPAGKRIATAGLDHKVVVWDAETGAVQTVFAGHTDRLYGAAFSEDGLRLASAGWDHTARLWNLQAIGQAKVLHGHGKMIWSAAFSADGSRLASGGDDGWARVWDPQTGRQMMAVNHVHKVSELAFGAKGERLLTAGGGLVRIWDLASGTQLGLLGGQPKQVRGMQVHPDGDRVIVDGSDGRVRIWSAGTGSLLTLLPHENIKSVAVCPNGKSLALGERGGDLRLLDLNDPKAPGTVIAGDKDDFYYMACSPDSRTVASVSGNLVRLWDLAAGSSRVVWQDDEHQAYRLAFTPDGKALAFTLDTGEVALTPLDGSPPTRLRGHTDMASGIAISPDGRRLVSTSEDASVRLWDLPAGRPAWRTTAVLSAPPQIHTQRGWEDLRTGGSLSPAPRLWREAIATQGRLADRLADGLVCILRQDESLQLWDPVADAQLKSWSVQHITRVQAVADGCACMSDTGRITLFVRSGISTDLVAEGATALARDQAQILAAAGPQILAFGPTGQALPRLAEVDPGVSALLRIEQTLVLGYQDGNLELFDLATGRRRTGLAFEELSARSVTALLPGPMGTLIAGFADGLVGIWDRTSGQRLDHARLHGPVVKLFASGAELFAVSELGDHLRWDLTVFQASHCELLAEIWAQVPVEWEGGHAVLRPPPADHPCYSGLPAR